MNPFAFLVIGVAVTWKEFLKTHWDVLAATDFFTVELWTAKGLIRYHVLFVIRLATREVHIAGLVPEPNEAWMKQITHNLFTVYTNLLVGQSYPLLTWANTGPSGGFAFANLILPTGLQGNLGVVGNTLSLTVTANTTPPCPGTPAMAVGIPAQPIGWAPQGPQPIRMR